MKILQVYLILIATCLVLIAAEKHADNKVMCMPRCKPYNIYPNESQHGSKMANQTFPLIYEKDIPFLFTPSNFIFYEGSSRNWDCKEQ